jgi:hypothetical protein
MNLSPRFARRIRPFVQDELGWKAMPVAAELQRLIDLARG